MVSNDKYKCFSRTFDHNLFFNLSKKNCEYEIIEIDKQGRSSQIVNALCSREIESRKESGDGGK